MTQSKTNVITRIFSNLGYKLTALALSLLIWRRIVTDSSSRIRGANFSRHLGSLSVWMLAEASITCGAPTDFNHSVEEIAHTPCRCWRTDSVVGD